MAPPPPSSKKRKAAPSRSRKRVVEEPEPPSKTLILGHQINAKNVLALAAGMTIVFGTIVAYKNTHPIIEPYAPASRGYTREVAEETTQKGVSPIEKWKNTWETDYGQFKVLQSLETARLQLITLQQNLIGAKKELEGAPNSQLIRDQIGTLEKQIKATNDRINVYETAGRK